MKPKSPLYLTLFLSLIFFQAKILLAADEITFITNKDPLTKRKISTEITKTPVNTNIYDLSFVAYDKEFADEFGLKQELITKMDKGFRFLEVKMITEGNKTNCYYNVVLDKGVEVAFPEGRNYFMNNNPKIDTSNATIFLPNQKDPAYKARVNQWEEFDKLFRNTSIDIMHQYTNRLYIGTQDYQKGKPSTQNSASLMYYIQDRLSYQIISMQSLSCEFDAKTFSTSNPSVWIAKNSQINYNTKINPSQDYFHRFLIPDSISKQISPIILEFKKQSFERFKKK
jgi:hypothetical protein